MANLAAFHQSSSPPPTTTTATLTTTKKQIDSTMNLCRDDFDGGPVSLDEIEKGLYLGNITAATHMETLKSYKISHILTLDSVPLPSHIVEASFLTAKYVQISDMPKEDILHHFDDCINFIESALKNDGNVLVHCYFGVSRSSSVVIAYIMKKYNLEYSQAFEKVKSKRRFVQPNEGFIFQLKLYRRMGYKIDPQYAKYKTYRLRLAADKVRKAKILPQSCMDLIKSDPGLTQENPEPIVYRCRKCRRIVATKSNLMVHIQKKNQSKETTNDEKRPSKKYTKVETNDEVQQSTATAAEETQVGPMPSTLATASSPLVLEQIASFQQEFRKCSISEKSGSENENENVNCRKIIFIEPLAWMKDILNQTQGRLNCPKCNQKLGSFSWINGCHCPCGAEIAPAFYLVPSKVELSNVVQNVQMTV